MERTSSFDPALIRRYDQDGPRYTSYPTAPQFHEGFGEREFREEAARSNDALIPAPLSLYVHVPYCFSPCFYCGCNRLITRDLSKGQRYLERLFREVELIAPLFDRDREVVQVHLGGGTPNFLSPEQIASLVACLGRHFNLGTAPDRDFSIELDPRHINDDGIAALAEIGFNRASLGVQDFNPEVQAAINREQSVETTVGVIDACRQHGFRSVNVDLIYGLPRQSVEGFRKTIETVIEARPERIAVYGYAHLPRLFKAQRQISEAELPDAETRLALLMDAVELFEQAGYRYIGLDHFAVPDDDLSRAQENRGLHRNFMGYTTHAECDLVGLGVSAISHVGASFSQNHRLLEGWEIAIDQGRLPIWRGMSLDFDDEVRGDVIQSLMCQGRVDKCSVERRFGIDFGEYFARDLAALEQLSEDGLLLTHDDVIEATSRGRYLLRIIAMCFDRYRQKDRLQQQQFSSAI